jgi:hypothetical protein
MDMVNAVGWLATAVFTASYFCRRPETLRRAQMLGALTWMAYGVLVGAAPVIVANVLVLSAAAWTARRSREGTTTGALPSNQG